MKPLRTGIAKTLLGLFGLALTGQVLAQVPDAPAPQPQKATIAVMSYDDFMPDRTGVSNEKIGLTEDLAARIIEKLSNSKRFNLVERNALRRVVMEQRFGKSLEKSYLDKSLDKAIDTMEAQYGFEVSATSAWSDHNDLVHDFKDMGSAIGADFIVLGDLEQMKGEQRSQAVPFSETGKTVDQRRVDARLRLRVIDAKSGVIKGAASVRTKLSEMLFAGRDVQTTGRLDVYDQLAAQAAAKILDLTFPATIVSTEPLVISRGSNDGVKVGDRYSVLREGKEIRNAAGMVLSRVQQEIGEIRVTQVQDLIAVAAPLSANGFALNDLVRPQASAAGSVAQAPTSSTVPLHKGQTKQTQGNKIPRLAVGLIKADSTARTSSLARIHSPLFTDTMISLLSQTKRFQLIDRQEVDQLLNEQMAQALAENRDMASVMGNLRGADYLVYGNLSTLSDEASVRQLPGSNRRITRRVGTATGNMRIVDARSGDVMESRQIAVELDLPADASASHGLDQIADAYGEQVVLMLMNALYPIKVAHVGSNGVIYVNRGKDGGLFSGEELVAYKQGVPIIDPDTGVQLGMEEELLGKLVVSEVDEARSKAEQIEGRSVQRGDLLKRRPKNRGKRASVIAAEQASAPQRTGAEIGAKTGRKGGKSTLAMGMVQLNRSARTSHGFGSGHLARISDDMITRLANSKRFQLMERQQVDQVLDEQAFESIAAGRNEQTRLRELQGADYLIHGEVGNFYIETKHEKVAYLDEVQTTRTRVAEGTIRIVDTHTGAVVGSEKVKVRDKVTGRQSDTEVMSGMIEAFSEDAVAKIIARLYPIKVLGASPDGSVYLNRGEESGLSEGDQFQVMRPGEALIDPDTGESFGSAEAQVATIEIIAIEGPRSRAEVIEGDTPMSGDIVRKLPASATKRRQQRVMEPSW